MAREGSGHAQFITNTDRMQPKVKLFTGFHRHKCFLVKYLNGFSFSSNYIRWCSRSGLRCSPLWLISLWIGRFQTVLLLTHCLHPSVCSSRVKGHSFMPNLKERWDDLACDSFMRIKNQFLWFNYKNLNFLSLIEFRRLWGNSDSQIQS